MLDGPLLKFHFSSTLAPGNPSTDFSTYSRFAIIILTISITAASIVSSVPCSISKSSFVIESQPFGFPSSSDSSSTLPTASLRAPFSLSSTAIRRWCLHHQHQPPSSARKRCLPGRRCSIFVDSDYNALQHSWGIRHDDEVAESMGEQARMGGKRMAGRIDRR